MHKHFLKIAASGALVLGLACGLRAYAQSDSSAPSNSNAQTNPSAPPGRGPMHHGPRMSPEQQLDHMGKMLNLTDEQKSQIKPILEDMHQQMQSIHSDTSLSRQERRTKMQSLMEDSHAKIRAILTDEQKAKLDAMHQHGREHMQKPQGAASQ